MVFLSIIVGHLVRKSSIYSDADGIAQRKIRFAHTISRPINAQFGGLKFYIVAIFKYGKRQLYGFRCAFNGQIKSAQIAVITFYDFGRNQRHSWVIYNIEIILIFQMIVSHSNTRIERVGFNSGRNSAFMQSIFIKNDLR